MGLTNSHMYKQRIIEGHRRRTPRPPNQRSWSSKDARATNTSRGCHCRRWPRLTRPPEPPASPVAAVAAKAYRASCNRRRQLSWGAPPPLVRLESAVAAYPLASGASSPLSCPPQERCRRSPALGSHRRSSASGRHRLLTSREPRRSSHAEGTTVAAAKTEFLSA
jgi:hypothetical protein